MKNTVVNFFALAVLCTLSLNGLAQNQKTTLIQPNVVPADEVKKALFIGNSFSFYNNGVHNHLGSLIRANDEWQVGENRLRLSTLSGGYMHEHIDDLRYLLSKPKGTWEAIILQGHSYEPIDPKTRERFATSVKQAVSLIKAEQLQPILLMTWGYKGQPDMGIDLANAYTSLANELDVLVVPVGVAFWVAEQQIPQIDLFVPDVLGLKNKTSDKAELTYRKDLKHPSNAGTYLMACVLYSALYQKSPEGNIFNAGLDPAIALKLQKLSWLVTSGFYKQNKETIPKQ
ncbi:MAG: hypothetical protein ACJAYN_002690 [Bermanella sp.]|jgi:hypothetical protein|uniref:hypothetical protein n=1 Tax=Glaciecola sp. 33A TaxID=2057807 RepID=UPI000C34FDEF|nr:hypothetical protein [Glaciecola sp. 33A]PKI02631.1 hypothetical protein CXF81_05390 [Glaciecola sp. 33A]